MAGEYPPVSAEIVPVHGQGANAARKLQELGFRVFAISSTISVEADEPLWTAVFGARFKDQAGSANAIGEQTTFRAVVKSTVTVPRNLRALIQEVIFIEPPAFFG